MNRDDVCRLELNYAGELEDLADCLRMVEPTYDQENDEEGLHEYIYGEVAGERVEAIRLVGEERAAIFSVGPPPFFSPSCLQRILRSLEEFNVQVTSYWTRDSLKAGVAVPYEGENA